MLGAFLARYFDVVILFPLTLLVSFCMLRHSVSFTTLTCLEVATPSFPAVSTSAGLHYFLSLLLVLGDSKYELEAEFEFDAELLVEAKLKVEALPLPG